MNFEFITTLPEPVLLNFLVQENITNYASDLDLRLIVTRLYSKYGLLLPDDEKYLQYDSFDDMYLSSDDDLVKLAQNNNINITLYTSRYQLIRELLELNVEPPISSIFARTPTPSLGSTSPSLSVSPSYFSQEANIRRAHRQSLRRPIAGLPIRTIPSPHKSNVQLRSNDEQLITPPSPPRTYGNGEGELIQLSPPEMRSPLSPIRQT